jgi:long-chain acyl-CoA synthetase
MVPSRLAVSAIVALVASTNLTTEAFAPSPLANHGSFTSLARLASSVTASLQEETLTQDEEDLLFGGPSPEQISRHRYKTKTGLILPDNASPPNPLDHSNDPLVNKLRTMRETVSSCPAIWKELAENCPSKKALVDEHLCDEKIDLTFAQMEEKVLRSAAAFRNLGVTKGVNVAVLGENSAMWLIVDHGIQLAGGASAVRGADAPVDELRYIYEHSDSAGIAVLQDVGLLKKLAKDAKSKGLGALGLSNDAFGDVKTVVLMHKGKSTVEEIKALGEESGVEVKVLSELLDSTSPSKYSDLPVVGKSDLSTSKCCHSHRFVLLLNLDS